MADDATNYQAKSRIEAARRDGKERLDLARLGLTAVPKSLGGLTQLEHLDLASNLLTVLPESLRGLARLQHLRLDVNSLTAVPESLGELTQLQQLDLRYNQLTALPESLGRLAQLQHLYLSRNSLTSLPESLGGLARLQHLDLRGNRLTTVPEALGRLTQLRFLSLSINRLAAVPESLGQLTRLEHLNLSGNQLAALPEGLGRLTQLRYLSLSRNQLTTLPESLGRLAELQELDLDGNGLLALPESLGGLTQLRRLDLHGNPALDIPPEILGPTIAEQLNGKKPADPRAILDWYFRNRAATAKRPILEAKVILVGWGAVGKTSLRRRLLNEPFDPKEKQTHKIEITPWPVTLRRDKATLHVWDFGGQEVMHATHQFFLTKRSLYVLVLAGREKAQGAQDAEYWLRLIDSFGGGSPTLVVLNKQDGCPHDLNRQALREKYPFIRGFVATDCQSRLGLPELRKRILAEVNALPDLRTEFDARWMAVKDAVAGMKKAGKKRMTVEEYYKLCGDKGEPDPKWQKWLLSFLHDLGVVVCFHEDPRLANDGVLDPQWVVDGIYRVLNEKALAGGDGRASYEQVRRLLPAAEYTDAEVRILLDMMEKFQLAFWLDDRRAGLVIPELMTEQEPVWKATFPAPDAGLQFELKYDFLPGGLIPRFIVATHHLSEGRERWRSGVILRKDGNAALVRGDATGTPPRVRILVTGPAATRRELLAVVRNEFAKIHASVPGLGVEERVPVPGLSVDPLGYDDLVALEAAGKRTVTVVAAGRVVELPLAGLLDGIDPKPKRAARAETNQARRQALLVQASGNARVTFTTGGGAATADSHDVTVEGDNFGQAGQALTDCTNTVTAMPPGDRKELAAELVARVGALLKALPADKRAEAPQVTAVPDSLGGLTRLRHLHLNVNRLTAVPDSLGRLTQLVNLDLSRNRLAVLPGSLGRLTQLQYLGLAGNGLTALPESLGGLTQLRTMDLHENPALGIPPEVFGPSIVKQARGEKPAPPRAILDWYFRNRSAALKRPILEAKVILVGWGAVGKTSLRRRLLGQPFNEKEEQTHRIEITPCPVAVGRDAVTLHVWDFGGQEVMHATHQFFLTKRSLYVLVLAGREKAQGAQDAEYWLRLIGSFGGGSPTLVVLNKQDSVPFDLNQKWLREKYPFIQGFVATDCASGRGLPELQRRVLAEVDRLPDLRTEFDARWMAIKDAVAGLKKAGTKRMTVDEYCKLCGAKGEPDPKWQKWLLGFLHDLGVVVCFHEDRRLANDGVLDPQWVVDGIYRVLNEKTLTGRDGRATYAQVRDLLPAAEYTDPEVGILLDMMEKFQLAFWLGDRRAELVIPELMTEQEPDSTATFPDPDAGLRFELKYTFLPGGLLPRFIVATHHLSADHERWRSGVILRQGKNAALVRGDATGTPPRVRILVNGPAATRRGLLEVIRNEFAKIHLTLPGLGVEERVPVPGHDVDPLGYDDLLALEAAGKKAVNLSGAVLMEASIMPRSAYDVVIACLREGGEQGWLSAAMTPKGPSHWTFEVFATGRPDTALFRARTDDNPFNPPGFADTLRRQYGDTQFARQEVGGEFVQVEGAEWPAELIDRRDRWFRDWPAGIVTKVIALDPSKGAREDSDYQAFALVGVDREGIVWCDAVANREGVQAMVERGVGLCRSWGPVAALAVEDNDGLGMLVTEFRRLTRERAQLVNVVPVRNTVNKVFRLRRLGGYLWEADEAYGPKLRLRDTPGGRLLAAQMKDFPLGEYDDCLDALELAIRVHEEPFQSPRRRGV